MRPLKRIGLFVAVPLLGLSIFAGVSLWSLQQYFGDSSHLKQWLVQSEFYPAVRDEIITQSTKQNIVDAKDASVTLRKPVVKKALERSITTEYLQNAAESVIDGTYDWLDGTSQKPTYTIDVAPIKKAFALSISNSAQARLNTLPDCVLADQATTTDPFTVNCSPPPSVSSTELQRLRTEIINSDEFLPKNIDANTYALSAEETVKNVSQQPWYETVSGLPTLFQWISRGPVIALLLGLIATVLIVFCSTSRRNGLRRVGVTILSSSLALALSSIVVLFLARYTTLPGADEGAALYQPMLDLFKLASGAVSQWQLITCLVLAAIGGGIVLGLRFTRPPASATPQPVRK